MFEDEDRWTTAYSLQLEISNEKEKLHQAIEGGEDFEALKKIDSRITELQKSLTDLRNKKTI